MAPATVLYPNLGENPNGYPRYTPLNTTSNGEIRLLRILPSPYKESVVCCKLFTVSLKTAPAFEALSYVWGSPDDNCPYPVFVHGHSTKVSNNLNDALRALRYVSNPRCMWIDALCINQSDNFEKSSQVLLMETVYSTAQKVIIWLGNESNDSALAMDALCSIKTKGDLRCIWPDSNTAIGNLFSRKWFSRVWVIQEFANARDPYFVCGTKTVGWRRVEQVLDEVILPDISRVHLKKNSRGPNLEIIEKLARGDIWIRLLMVRKRLLVPNSGTYGSSWTFSAVLDSHTDLDASVAQDKIYALLGLRTSAEDTPDSHESTPTPTIDYDRPSNEVFTEWARYIIHHEQSLDILFSCQKTVPEPGLPSWAPNWRLRSADQYVPNFSKSLIHFHPNSGKSVHLSFSSDGKQLSVKGRVVLSITKEFTFSNVPPSYHQQFFPFLPPTYLTYQFRGLRQQSSSAIKHLREIVDLPDLGHAFGNSEIGQNPDLMLKMNVSRLHRDYTSRKDETPARLAKLRDVISMNRKKFEGLGKWSGLVPKQTQIGDIICMIQGVQALFVLRPHEGNYQVVGECFVEGCMKGERTWKCKKQTFVLV